MSTPEAQRAINRGASVIIPCLLVGTVGVATYVVVVRLGVDYLLRPSSDLQLTAAYPVNPRRGTAIAIIVVYCILLALMTLPYLRTFQVIQTNPGYIRRGPHAQRDQPPAAQAPKSRPSSAPVPRPPSKNALPNPTPAAAAAATAPPPRPRPQSHLRRHRRPAPGLERFYAKDAFVCDMSGLPIFCPKCDNWKRDRTHHCSEVGRCVRRMDHFCPWIGGIVSETNLKFFLQFVVYAALYTLFMLVVLAVFVAEQVRIGLGRDAWLIGILVCSATFFFFAAGMSGSVIQMSLRNYTTVENLFKGNKTYFIAVYTGPQTPQAAMERPLYPTVTYPLRPTPGADIRQFAILQTKPGENPWDLGALQNWRELMGYSWLEWLLPIKYSPFCKHGARYEYPFGPVLDRMRREAGLSSR
ncbi:Palmitoyltransferase pfa5 [Coniosporium tulheliwenetii]|uniref:Palmitoyltransferase pfa5 n=1 Tax=Coniosporium tulheliwenetii TaxID=3383036 RepID=A0ACC2ZDV5_9PEZI|nr:Palmitoyltransferase pfa5 [Cladosporium sp. JES 115]